MRPSRLPGLSRPVDWLLSSVGLPGFLPGDNSRPGDADWDATVVGAGVGSGDWILFTFRGRLVNVCSRSMRFVYRWTRPAVFKTPVVPVPDVNGPAGSGLNGDEFRVGLRQGVEEGVVRCADGSPYIRLRGWRSQQFAADVDEFLGVDHGVVFSSSLCHSYEGSFVLM